MLREASPLLVNQNSNARTSMLFLAGLRIVFVVMLMAVGWSLASDEKNLAGSLASHRDLILIGSMGAGLIVIALDLFVPRKSLATIAGVFFGLLIGMVIAYGLSLVLDLSLRANQAADAVVDPRRASFISAVKLAFGVICCYVAVSFILQTKDDVRFVIPYVQFARERKGSSPMVLDTSVIVDGRIADIANTGVLDSELVVPRFVLQELQTIADSTDKLKRARGRRGLDMLNKLQTNDKIDIQVLEVRPDRGAQDAGVDEMLVDLAKQLEGKVVTNDYNLNKVAQLRGVGVININDLANALKPVVLPGETMTIKVLKPGEEIGQGVGYLEDGTMVVAEGGREKIGEVVELIVTSVLQTSAGRMIFGRLDGVVIPERRRPKPSGNRTG